MASPAQRVKSPSLVESSSIWSATTAAMSSTVKSTSRIRPMTVNILVAAGSQ
ncbi:hypothetical protein J7E88_27095 [Streptomyces sp. ISL-10]|uniref:hypothetical protein n=1 Tax=Streptomyces sp. ISL-10 TaxID=2819172 RepID=UPI001BED11D5|nr:hypothetical protein [Streptomyces sp. ISL-10]MBT2368885.1 hypothetical protein [Streptomyces sp. ISL-10]